MAQLVARSTVNQEFGLIIASDRYNKIDALLV
jgi:hypothetical protein